MKRKLILFAVIITVSFMLYPQCVEAKAFGTEEREIITEIGAGFCEITTVKETKFLWITVGKSYEYDIVKCDSLK